MSRPGWAMGMGETLAREALEETGLTVEVIRPIHLCHFTKDPFWVTCVTPLCDDAGGEVHLSDENDGHAWIELEEIPERTYARTIAERLDTFLALARAERTQEGGETREQ